MNPLSVSNLLWPADEADQALGFLADLGVQGIEVAPGRVAATSRESVAAFRQFGQSCRRAGLSIPAFQAILYGTSGLELLGSEDAFVALDRHLAVVAELASAVGAQILVFGSPKNRLLNGLSQQDAFDLGAQRLRRLGRTLSPFGVKLGIEPVPPAYGGEFLENWRSALDMVRIVGSPEIVLHLDVGCVTLGGDDIGEAILQSGAHIGHYHIAQQHFRSYLNPDPAHAQAAQALRDIHYRHWLSLEMMTVANWREEARRAVQFARSAYGAE